MEWNQNFINEFLDSSGIPGAKKEYKFDTAGLPPNDPPEENNEEKPEKPDDFPIKNMIKFRKWLVNKLKVLSENNSITGFNNLKEELSKHLLNLAAEPSGIEEDESFVFNIFLEYRETEDFLGDPGDEFFDQVDFSVNNQGVNDEFFYVIVSPIPRILNNQLLIDLQKSSGDDNLIKNQFVGRHFPGFDLDIAYASTHSDIEEDYSEKDGEASYFKLHGAECFRFKK